MTLIEVLAALALLGSLAVAMVLSRGRLVEQHQRAEQKREAVQAADELLTRWWTSEHKPVPIDASGQVPGHEGWTWQTRGIDDRSLRAFHAQLVRLSVFDASPSGQPVELTSIDVVLPRQAEAARP